jgi:hypothetical protein
MTEKKESIDQLDARIAELEFEKARLQSRIVYLEESMRKVFYNTRTMTLAHINWIARQALGEVGMKYLEK